MRAAEMRDIIISKLKDGPKTTPELVEMTHLVEQQNFASGQIKVMVLERRDRQQVGKGMCADEKRRTQCGIGVAYRIPSCRRRNGCGAYR